MTYKILENRSYLVHLASGVPEENLQAYGEIVSKIWDNYPDCNPKHVGYVLKRGIHKFYAYQEVPSDTKRKR